MISDVILIFVLLIIPDNYIWHSLILGESVTTLTHGKTLPAPFSQTCVLKANRKCVHPQMLGTTDSGKKKKHRQPNKAKSDQASGLPVLLSQTCEPEARRRWAHRPVSEISLSAGEGRGRQKRRETLTGRQQESHKTIKKKNGAKRGKVCQEKEVGRREQHIEYSVRPQGKWGYSMLAGVANIRATNI